MDIAIHLSWSPILLAIVLLIIACSAIYLLFFKSDGFKIKPKYVIMCYFLYTLVALYAAFDVGHRQSDLKRSSFDAVPANVVTDKVESGRLTVDEVKQTFEQSVKHTQ